MKQRRYMVEVTRPASGYGESYRREETKTITVWAATEHEAASEARSETGMHFGDTEVTPL